MGGVGNELGRFSTPRKSPRAFLRRAAGTVWDEKKEPQAALLAFSGADAWLGTRWCKCKEGAGSEK
jgi:hypothetical protein